MFSKAVRRMLTDRNLIRALQVDTTGPLVESVKRAAGGIVITIKNLGAGSGVELHSAAGFEVLTADSKWASVPIQTHTNETVAVGDAKGATKLRYSWYSNPCGEDCFGCAVYIAAKPLVAGPSRRSSPSPACDV